MLWCLRWQKLYLGGLDDATCYKVDGRKILVTLKRGWRGAELKEFLLNEPTVVQVEWEQVKYTPQQAHMREAARRARQKPKGKSKGRKGKSKRRKGKRKGKSSKKKRKATKPTP